MATGSSDRNTQEVTRCTTCGMRIQTNCDYQQGRCPHNPSLLEVIMSTQYYQRFLNLFKLFKGKK
jgi:hypothetical protein